MRKYTIVVVIVNLFILVIRADCFAEELVWQNISRENLDLRAVLINPDNPNIIYAGSGTGIIKSEDGGKSWRSILSVRGQNRCVNFLLFGTQGKNCLYAATGSGLFYSLNEGKSWKRIFQGKNYLENECTSIFVSSAAIYLGTKAGLFISEDNGRSWHKEKGKLANSGIFVIVSNKTKPEYIYTVCTDGLFKAMGDNHDWERILVAHSAHRDFETGEETEGEDEEEEFSGIKYVSCDPNNTNFLYTATSTGVYKSCDNGQNWDLIPSYGLLNQDVRFLLFSNRGNLYAITKSGIFEFVTSRWQELSFGLAVGQVRSLAIDNQNNLYAACDKGLFRAGMAYINYNSGGPAIASYYKDEPKINEVQEAAIKYAEVGQDKIKKWRKQAAKKAILPQVSIDLDRNAGDLWHWETGSSTKIEDDILRKGRDTLDWGVTLSWDLGELIWNNDQTSIDVRSRLMVELRDDILDEVTKLYFERIRVKIEMNNLTIEDRKKRFEKELKLQELTASLDALTGGYFSSHSSG